MNAALIGSVSSSIAALSGMIRGGLEVVGVCGLRLPPGESISDYHMCTLDVLANQAGIPFLPFERVNDPAVAEFLKSHRPDWLFVIGLSQMVPVHIRNLAHAGAIGFHPTPLPEGRGRAPVAWTILLQRPAAANLFFLTDEPDAGDIIAQRAVPVLPDDYAADLIARTNDVLEQMVVDLSPAFASGQVPRTPQDHSRATYYARRRAEDGRIDWNTPADEIYRLVRAVSHPYPGAFTFHRGHKLVIWRAHPTGAESTAAEPGTIVRLADGIPVVRTASEHLALTDIQWADGPGTELREGEEFDSTG